MNQDFISQTRFDQTVCSDFDQMLKAAIPHLPPKGQQFLSIYEKARELRNTILLFSQGNNSLSSNTAPPERPIDILSDIRDSCYGQSRQTLDDILNVFAMLEMAKVMGFTSSDHSDAPEEEDSHE